MTLSVIENIEAHRAALEARAGTLAGARRITAPEVAPPQPTAGAQAAQATGGGGDSLFSALIDTVNPLQHIPGVSTVYRATTGDAMSPLANLSGGFLFGGPMGLAIGAASTFIEMMTGATPVEHAMALLQGELGEEEITEPTEQASLGDTALVGTNDTRAPGDAKVLDQAEAVRNPGFGAARDTVAISSAIWTDRALMDAAGKYENADRMARDDQNSRDNAKAHNKTDRTA